jgi:hypothetical protein
MGKFASILESIRNRPEFDSLKPSPEERGIKTSLFDLLDIVRAERLDITSLHEDDNAILKKQLLTIEKAVGKLAFHEEVSANLQEKVQDYVDKHLKRFEIELIENPKDDTTATNHRIFTTFRNLLHGSSEDENALEAARALDAGVPKSVYNPIQKLQAYTFTPDKAAVVLNTIGETPTKDDLVKYFASVQEDIDIQKDAFKETDEWRAKAEVVKLALGFYGAHKDEPLVHDQILYIVKKADGQISATWEVKGKPAADTEIYSFTLNGGLKDPYNLWTHANDLDQANIVKDIADIAFIGSEKLYSGECSDEEFRALYINIENHKEYLMKGKPEGYEKAFAKLDAIAAAIREKQLEQHPEEVWYKPGVNIYEYAELDLQ